MILDVIMLHFYTIYVDTDPCIPIKSKIGMVPLYPSLFLMVLVIHIIRFI